RSAPRVDRSGSLAATARRAQAEERAAGVAHLAGPAKSGGGLALARSSPRITRIDGKVGEIQQSAPNGAQGRMIRQQQVEEAVESMGHRDVLAQFLQQSLQVLLRRLLAVERHQVAKRLFGAGESQG